MVRRSGQIKDDPLFEKVKARLIQQAEEGGKMESETELAAHFKVTRYRIRKALDALTQMGILKRSPKVGMTVQKISSSDLHDQLEARFNIAEFDPNDFAEARILIETALIPLIIKRMTPSQAGKLEETVEGILKNAAQPVIATQLERSFHLLLLETCGNQILQLFSSVLVHTFDKSDSFFVRMEELYFREIASAYKKILNEIKAGNSEQAQRLLKSLLDQQVNFLAG